MRCVAPESTRSSSMEDNKLSVQRHGHHHNGISKPPVHGGGGGKGRGRQAGKQGIKVVYISSPMKLTASAEEFRAVVQELTGRDSNVADHDFSSANANARTYSSSLLARGASPPTATTSEAAAAPPTVMATANAGAGRWAVADQCADAGSAGAGVVGATPFHQMSMYDQTPSLLYGQDYW